MKRPFISREIQKTNTETYPTPFTYMRSWIRQTARALHQAFSWNPGFSGVFRYQSDSNPAILKILKEEGCGVDQLAMWSR